MVSNKMKFFDYIFYRSYMYYKRHDDLPFSTSVFLVSSEILILTGFVWMGMLDILLPQMPKHAYLVTLIMYLFVYFRYRNRVDTLKQAFKNSKYNRQIPDWMCAWGALIPSVIIGTIFILCTRAYITNHNLSGVLWPYIEPYVGQYLY